MAATDPSLDPSLTGATDPSFAQRWGPLIAQGAGAVGGIYASRAAQAAAMNRSPEELAALGGASGAAGQLGQTGQSLLTQSAPYIGQPASYYQTLLRGSRAAMANVTAPYRAQVNDTYRGAQANLAQSGIRGAAKDVQAGTLARQRASDVAKLTTGVQPGAAAALAQLGQGQQTAGLQATGQAGNIYGNLLGQAATNRAQAMQEGDKTGQAAGKLIADLGTTAFGGKKPTAGTPPPKPPTGPDVGSTTTVPEANPPYYGPIEGSGDYSTSGDYGKPYDPSTYGYGS